MSRAQEERSLHSGWNPVTPARIPLTAPVVFRSRKTRRWRGFSLFSLGRPREHCGPGGCRHQDLGVDWGQARNGHQHRYGALRLWSFLSAAVFVAIFVVAVVFVYCNCPLGPLHHHPSSAPPCNVVSKERSCWTIMQHCIIMYELGSNQVEKDKVLTRKSFDVSSHNITVHAFYSNAKHTRNGQ